MNQNIESLVAQMTLEEKISMFAGASIWTTVGVKHLGIPAIKMTDGPVGARGSRSRTGPTSACFPAGIALAATWNTDLVRRVGMALGEEVKAKGAHILLAPTVNLHRSPLAGRHFECFSEDPYLSGRIAAAYIDGLQSQGVGACIKHFVCNDSEFQRMTISSEVDERALREIYLFPFQMAIQEAKPWAVMSAYNKLNGIYCSENSYLLQDILKGEWGFEGIVLSDWYGTYSPNAAGGGLDLEMPGPARWMGAELLQLVRSGQIGEAVVDDKVRRLLGVIDRAGGFEAPGIEPERAVDRPEHRRLAREAAAEAIVLLKNRGAVLPLNPGKIRSIAVIGQNARHAQIQGGGSAHVTPHYVISPLEGIVRAAGDQVDVGYEIGCTIHRMLPLLDVDALTTKDGSQPGLSVQYFDGPQLLGEPIHTAVTEHTDLVWFGEQVPGADSGDFSVRLLGRFLAASTGQYSFGLKSAGRSRLLIDGNVVIDNWSGIPPDAGRETVAIVDLVLGRSYDLQVDYGPEMPATTPPGGARPELRLGCLPPIPADSIQRAVDLAARSDVAILFAGLTDEWEREGEDRPDMELRGDQVILIEQVAAANPNTVVVLNTGSPIAMDWLDRVAAVIQAWYPGQEAGNAIADVLFGQVCPSGRLPTSFPRRLADSPVHRPASVPASYPGKRGRVQYGESIFAGYRHYDREGIEPLFPFGFGLSYTTFEYRNLTLSAREYRAGDDIRVHVQVENTGPVPGKEVVHLYVRDAEASVPRPAKELKAFAKVLLQPGECKTISFTLGEEALAFYDPDQKRWVVEPGEFELFVGSSSRDARLAGRFVWRS